MKKILYSVGMVTALSLALSSCKKDYLNTTPTDQVDAKLAYSTTTNLMSAVNGMYRNMYTAGANQDEGGESSIMIDMDMEGEDLVNPSTGSGWFITGSSVYKLNIQKIATATQTKYIYKYYYTLIENANAILENVDAATGSDADKKVIKGEALTMRAYAHFKLVQIFAKRYDATTVPNTQAGIPLKLTSALDPTARATVEDVYTQINKDLDAAITNLTGATARATKSHINLSVAQGIKARVALTQQNWAVAANYAALARAGYPLMSNADYTAGFNAIGNGEWMWGIQQIADQTTFFSSFFAYMSVNFNSSHIRGDPKCINNLLYNQISSTDIRKTLWDPTGANTALFPIPPNGTRYPYMNRKFKAFDSGNSYGDLAFMRAGEMYLIEAEANARLGTVAGTLAAQTALFTLASNRDPVGYTKPSVNVGTALINEIMVQRRIELWGEGFRFTDLKRQNLGIDRNGANHVASVATNFTLPAGDTGWQFLFPQDEINANPLLTQNP